MLKGLKIKLKWLWLSFKTKIKNVVINRLQPAIESHVSLVDILSDRDSEFKRVQNFLDAKTAPLRPRTGISHKLITTFNPRPIKLLISTNLFLLVIIR